MQVWGPLIFESRRWVELRQQSFWRQFLSAESTGMGIFYTLNVFCIQVSCSCNADSEMQRRSAFQIVTRCVQQQANGRILLEPQYEAPSPA